MSVLMPPAPPPTHSIASMAQDCSPVTAVQDTLVHSVRKKWTIVILILVEMESALLPSMISPVNALWGLLAQSVMWILIFVSVQMFVSMEGLAWMGYVAKLQMCMTTKGNGMYAAWYSHRRILAYECQKKVYGSKCVLLQHASIIICGHSTVSKDI